MWSLVAIIATVGLFTWLAVFITGVFIFLGEDISDWLQAKADEIRARTELLRNEKDKEPTN